METTSTNKVSTTSTLTLDSNDPIYVSPSDDSYTEFDDLLRLGAIRKLPMYVDTVGGGGGANLLNVHLLSSGSYSEFVDRLPNSGTVRAQLYRTSYGCSIASRR